MLNNFREAACPWMRSVQSHGCRKEFFLNSFGYKMVRIRLPEQYDHQKFKKSNNSQAFQLIFIIGSIINCKITQIQKS